MKKIILSAIALCAFGFANAQIKTEAGTFTKPVSGTYIMEANMTPNIAGGGGIFSLPTLNNDLGMVGIKVRNFSADSKAVRMSANLTVRNSGVEGENTEFSIGAGYGIENHMAGAERLSTYWGYEGNVGYVSSNGKAGEVDPVSGDVTGFEAKSTKLGLGGNLFTGFDYYIMPKIYLGVEVSYALAVTSTTPDGGDATTKFELAPGITPTFRLGWQF